MSAGSDQVRELLERVTDALGVDAEVEVMEDDDAIRGMLHGDDLGLFIGRQAPRSTLCSTSRSRSPLATTPQRRE